MHFAIGMKNEAGEPLIQLDGVDVCTVDHMKELIASYEAHAGTGQPHEMDGELIALNRLASAMDRVAKGADAFRKALDDLAGSEHGGIRIEAAGEVMTCEIKPAAGGRATDAIVETRLNKLDSQADLLESLLISLEAKP